MKYIFEILVGKRAFKGPLRITYLDDIGDEEKIVRQEYQIGCYKVLIQRNKKRGESP